MSEDLKTAPPTEASTPAPEHPLLKALRVGVSGLDGITISESMGMTEFLLADPTLISDACRFLKEGMEPAFNMLLDIVGIDYWDVEPRYGLVYNLHSFGSNERVYLKIRVSSGDAQVPSITPLWSGANWMEREVFDMFGVRFTGHPDLRKVLTADDLEGHPLRKDFPLGNVDIWPEGADTVIAR